MRGKRTLLIPFDTVVDDSNLSRGKGRSITLIESRDINLIARYYYHTYFKRLRYEAVIAELTKEFYIAERTIIDRLLKHDEALNKLIKQAPTLLELKKAIPLVDLVIWFIISYFAYDL